MVFEIEGFDTGFCGFGFVEVLVDGGGLGFAEADEIDDVGEDFDEAIVGGFEEVGEGEVVDTALGLLSKPSFLPLKMEEGIPQPGVSVARHRSPSSSSYLPVRSHYSLCIHPLLLRASPAPPSPLWYSSEARRTIRTPSALAVGSA